VKASSLLIDRQVWVADLGRVPYAEGQALQQRVVTWRQQGVVGDTLLLLEHEPVITPGRRADESHILASSEVLRREGIDVCRTERGGDVTYHGPGQLIAYPIMHLPSLGLGASDYMHRLEDVVARVLEEYGVVTHRREHVIGVWVGGDKIAALGVRIKRGVSFHGLAFNVDPDMQRWSYIVPCGITDGGVTSLRQELGYAPPMADVRRLVKAAFEDLFGVTLVSMPVDALEIRPKTRQLENGPASRVCLGQSRRK